MPDPTLGAGFARALMELAVSKGADRKLLAARSEIDPADLQDQDNRIPFAKFVALMRVSKEMCNDPALGLHFGEAFEIGELSVVGLVGGASETMAEGFARVNRYARLAVEIAGAETGDRYQLKRGARQLWIVDTRPNANDFIEMTESSFARMVCAARRHFGEKHFVKAVHFTHADPGYRAEYDRIFQAPVVFESDKNALLTDDKWLTQRTAPSSRYLHAILSAHAEDLLKSLESSKTTKGRVESVLMSSLHTGDASMGTVADRLEVSRQTLFRRLKAEGATFEKVLDELRHKMALHYLSEKKVSVSETAYLVGFSEPAAFSRAFKRWTGASPREARVKD